MEKLSLSPVGSYVRNSVWYVACCMTLRMSRKENCTFHWFVRGYGKGTEFKFEAHDMRHARRAFGNDRADCSPTLPSM